MQPLTEVKPNAMVYVLWRERLTRGRVTKYLEPISAIAAFPRRIEVLLIDHPSILLQLKSSDVVCV